MQATTTTLAASTSVAVASASLANSSSVTNLWSMIHQLQMLFLLLLLQCYIPEDVRAVIKGPEFSIDVYQYISLSGAGFYKSLYANFNFDITSGHLEDIGIESDSAIYNSYSMLTWILLLVPLHVVVHFALK